MSSIYLVAKESACTFIAHRLACSQLSCQVHLFIKAICGCERGCTGASLRFCEQMPQVASTRGASLSTRGMRAPTERALLELQRRFLICKVDVTGRTRGTYAYVWDLAERFWPESFAHACTIHPGTARHRIQGQLGIFGIESSTQLESKLFLWR